MHAPAINLALLASMLVAFWPAVAIAQPGATLAGQIELSRLVDLAAERAGVRIEYDAARLQGRVTLRGHGALSDDQLWSLAARTLASRNLTTIRLAGDGTLSVVPIAEAAGLSSVEDFESLLEAPSIGRPGFAAVVYNLQHAPADLLEDAIEPYRTRNGGVVTRAHQGRSLVISDLTPRLEQIRDVLAREDVPGPAASVSYIHPERLAPAALAALAMEVRDKSAGLGFAAPRGEVFAQPHQQEVAILAPPDDVAAWESLLRRLDRSAPMETRVYAPGSFTLEEVAELIESVAAAQSDLRSDPDAPQFSVVRDALTNTMVITGHDSHHALVQDTLDRLAATPASQRRTARHFPIRHRAVGEVAALLNQLLETAEPDGSHPLEPGQGPFQSRPEVPRGPEPAGAGLLGEQRTGSTLATATAASPRMAPASLTLLADEATNTLIALGEPRNIAQIEDLLRTIDVRQPQVMLEVVLVSLSDAQTRNLGVEMAGLIKTGELRVRLSSLFGLSTIAAGLPGGGVGGTGGTVSVIAPEDFALVIRALESVNKGRSLSSPRVLVGNGQQASLNSTLGQPITSVNASDTVATTSFAGFSDAGTQVSITPRIAAGDHLLLEYSITLSAFVGESPGAGIPPPRQQNQLQSVVTIPDGYTVVIGGIELATEAEAESRVPLIGSIPVIREAFRTRSWSDNRQRFFVFIRAEVDRGRSFEGLRHVSDGAMGEAGVEGWPEVSPRLVR